MITVRHRRTDPTPICGCDSPTTIEADFQGARPVITIICDTCGALSQSISVPNAKIHIEELHAIPDSGTKAAV